MEIEDIVEHPIAKIAGLIAVTITIISFLKR